MTTINVTVPLTPAYDSSYHGLVSTRESYVEISIDVQQGDHTYTSPFREVGALKYFSPPYLEAALRVSYSYSCADDVLELYGNDFVAPDHSTALLTRPVGSGEVCHQRTYHGCVNQRDTSPNWSHSTPYTPGLASALTLSVRKANESIIAAATRLFRVVRVHTPPPTLETAEEINKWTMMYACDGTLLGSFDPTRRYPDGTTMVNHLQSTWGGTVTFKQGEHIANVIGSSSDPKINGQAWIELWERQYGLEDMCTSHDWASGKKFTCNDGSQANRIGGHIVTGTTAKRMPKGSNDVYIIPICKAHNGNDNVYMRAYVYTGGIWLKNYLGT